MSEPREYHGAITADGKIRFDDAIGWNGRVAQLRGKRIVCTVEREQARRTTQANARYWAVLVPLARHLLSQTRDVPLSKDQTHYVLASAFAGTEDTALGVSIPVKTHLLNVEQFHTYCLSIEAWLAQHGYQVPESGEALEAVL